MSNQLNDASASVNIKNNRRRSKTKSSCLCPISSTMPALVLILRTTEEGATKSSCLCLISSMMQALVLILRTPEEGAKQRAVVCIQLVQRCQR